LSYSHTASTNLSPIGKLVTFLFAPLGGRSEGSTLEAPRLDNLKDFAAPEKGCDELERTIEHRRSVIEMVVHDIRSPLMSSQISVDLVEELSLHISDGGYQALESARRKLELTLSRAKGLLDCLKDRTKSEDLLLNTTHSGRTFSGKDALSLSALNLTQTMSFVTQELRTELIDASRFLERFEFLEGQNLSEPCRKHLLRAQSGIKRAISLIKDELRMEYLHNNSVYLEKSPCLVSEVANDAIASLKSLADQKQIKLIHNYRDELINADRGRIVQVLINYLANAIKFSPENTHIVLSCQVLANAIRLSVKDEGPGLDQDTRATVFERFCQASPLHSAEGYGLGLAICKLIAEAHGGQVGVESEPGTGSTFWLKLPRF
jgi:signal transduction histidine kinase